MNEKKYKLTDETITCLGKVLRRIEALKDFSDIKKGDKSEFIEKVANLSNFGNTWVFGNARIYGDAIITSSKDYIVFKNWWSSGRHFTWTRSNNTWRVGCFYGSGKELIEKAYKDSKLSGKEYKRVVDYVENIIKEEI